MDWNPAAGAAVGRAMVKGNRSHAPMAIVSVRWNGEPLAMKVARGGESVLAGDTEGAVARLPEDALGCAARTLADTRGGVHAHVPEDKVASITGPAGMRLIVGPQRVELALGEECSVLLGAFEVTVAAHASEPAPARRRIGAGAWIHTAMVAAIHGALLFAGHRAAFAAQFEDDTSPQIEQIRSYLAASEDRSIAQDKVQFALGGKSSERRANGERGNGKDGGGERHQGDQGQAGSAVSRGKARHFGAEAQEKKSEALAADDIETARSFGMVGLLQAAQTAALKRQDGATAWGESDPFNAMGGMLGRMVGESAGHEGLALTGIGEGGGGTGEGIGLGTIGTIGHTNGLAGIGTGGMGGSASGFGFGSGRGRWGRDHIPRPHHVYCCSASVSGRLPPETIRRIVRQNFGRMRACYEDGLLRNPSLAGRVTTRFVIGRDGSVMTSANAGSELADPKVNSCVTRAFYGISFPQPEGGIVEVTYPIVFSNG